MSNVSLFENDVVPLVQKKKKYQTFTVKEIGGPNEIVLWREAQKAKEAQNQAVRMQLVESKKMALTDLTLPDTGEVTWNGSASLVHGRGDGTGAMSWSDKLKYASERKDGYMKPDFMQFKEHPKWEPTTEPKKNIIQRLKGWVTSLWQSANF